jgi:hypothetical protein
MLPSIALIWPFSALRCAGPSVCAAPTDRACPPAPQACLDTPARADGSSSRRHDSVVCKPLANRYSNLPDVELRPGTAACHACSSDAGSSEHDPRSSRLPYHDPALSVTHVSLADMAPNLFTAKDQDPSSSTPRCQRSTSSSAPVWGPVRSRLSSAP